MNRIESLNNPVARNIQSIIELKGLKQKAVAENAGLTAQSLCDVISGRRAVSYTHLYRRFNGKRMTIGCYFLFKRCFSTQSATPSSSLESARSSA